MNKSEKSLRWVVNQIPDFKPTTNEEKMLVAIKLYSEAGAEEIRRLETENASLRERLSKAVELPCKVGDIIYIITFGYNGKHVTPDNLADCWSYGMEEVEVTEDNLFIMCSHFKDGSAFTDRAAAQKRLAELGGK